MRLSKKVSDIILSTLVLILFVVTNPGCDCRQRGSSDPPEGRVPQKSSDDSSVDPDDATIDSEDNETSPSPEVKDAERRTEGSGDEDGDDEQSDAKSARQSESAGGDRGTVHADHQARLRRAEALLKSAEGDTGSPTQKVQVMLRALAVLGNDESRESQSLRKELLKKMKAAETELPNVTGNREYNIR